MILSRYINSVHSPGTQYNHRVPKRLWLFTLQVFNEQLYYTTRVWRCSGNIYGVSRLRFANVIRHLRVKSLMLIRFVAFAPTAMIVRL